MEVLKSPKKPIFYTCNICNYNTLYKRDYSRHLLTPKHENNENGSISGLLEVKKAQKSPLPFKCCCNKDFTTHGGLWKHKNKCDFVNKPTLDEPNKFTDNSNLITYLMKENSELKNMIVDVCKNNNTLSNNTINSHNKTFNLNLFLNEECKDAMNIMEFVDSLQLQFSDLENVGRLGFINGISDIIIKNLKALDIHKRPVHCTDLKREVMYVKDENQWEKEAEDNMKIRKAIKCIAQKNTKNLVLFKQKHPDCLQGDSRSSDQYNKLIREAFGGGSDKDDTTSENKIISRISKEITIEKVL